ncbi:MAG: hypothetical protein ACLS5W_06800 [Coprococcus sp.]
MTWPFENNTNAITRKLAKRSLQADKRRNIFLIVTITLTTALLSGIFFTVFAEQRKMLSDLRGQYQTVVMETTQKKSNIFLRSLKLSSGDCQKILDQPGIKIVLS